MDTMDGHGQPGMGMAPSPQEIMMERMWEYLADDQKRILIKRMIDNKILTKEAMIKPLEHTIDTMKILRKMLESC
jgi:hypothetical protein